MNKKLISSFLVMAISITALSPLYSKLSLSNNLHPSTGLNQDSTGQVSATQQTLSSAGYTVTYDMENLKSEALMLKKSGALLPDKTAKSAESATEVKPAANTAKTVAKAPAQTKTTTAKKTTLSSRSTTTSTPTRTAKTRPTAVKPVSTTVAPSTTSTASSKALAVIRTAKSYIGVPYVWGGTSPSGFDCSGFSQYVLGKNGISVPRTAADQYNAGIRVSRSNLRVGDLVFFTTYKPGPSHLGFYIGDGKFIHASSSKGVTISSLNSSYYSSRYIGARRVIK